jgi:hypothetical protein
MKSKMKSKTINYIRAGYPGLYLVSAEEQRVALKMTRIAQEFPSPHLPDRHKSRRFQTSPTT